MAYEKRWKAIPPTLFTSDGGTLGRLTVASTKRFKVKQKVTVVCPSKPTLFLEVKRVDSSTVMFLGPVGGSIDDRTDLSGYTVLSGSYIYADEQLRSSVPMQDVERATYAEEPTVARRVTLIDPYGEYYDDDNPVPVEGTISVSPEGMSTPTIDNIVAPTPTEYTILLPKTTKKFLIRTRSHMSFHISYVAGTTNTTYLTVSMGCYYNEDNLMLSTVLPVYVKPNKPNEIIEVLYWQ